MSRIVSGYKSIIIFESIQTQNSPNVLPKGIFIYHFWLDLVNHDKIVLIWYSNNLDT